MIYKSAVEQIKGAKAAESEMLLPVFRLGTVTNLSSGRAYIQFYGEQTASSKLYPYLEGYKPTVGDKVLILQQGSTYIIAGKISKDNVVDNYYMLKSLADQTYLTKAVADTLYEPLGGGGGGSSDKIQNDTYYLGFSGSTSTVVIGNRKSGTTTALDLGSTSYPFNAGYFKTLGGASSSNAVGTLNVKDVNLYGDILPDTTNARTLGSSSKKFKNIYAETADITTFAFGTWKPNSSYTYGIQGSSSNSGATFKPTSSGGVNLGDATYKFESGYFKTLGGASAANGIQTLNVKDYVSYGTFLPDASNSRDLGSTAKYWSNIYSDKIRINKLGCGAAGSSVVYFELTSSSSPARMNPNTNKAIALGSSSYQYHSVYANQFYQNGTAISTSDRRKKTGIKDFTKKYIEFFKKLKPKLFRFKDGESGRLHSGFIAQDVEEAAAESGISTKDLAFLCIDKDGNYGLRYEELIALQTKVIQDLMARVEALEEKVKGGN